MARKPFQFGTTRPTLLSDPLPPAQLGALPKDAMKIPPAGPVPPPVDVPPEEAAAFNQMGAEQLDTMAFASNTLGGISGLSVAKQAAAPAAEEVPLPPVVPGKEEKKPDPKGKEAPAAPKEEAPAGEDKPMFSERDAQEWRDTERMRARGWSERRILQEKSNKIYGGATNVPGSLEGLSDEMKQQAMAQFRIEEGPKKGLNGMMNQEDWRDQFKQKNANPPMGFMNEFTNDNGSAKWTGDIGQKGGIYQEKVGGTWVQQQRPGHMVLRSHFGEDWEQREGEDTADTIRRRAQMISGESSGWQQPYAPTVNQDTSLFNPREASNSIVAPAGSRIATGKYGSGYATNVPAMPAATPVTAPSSVKKSLNPPIPDDVIKSLGLPT